MRRKPEIDPLSAPQTSSNAAALLSKSSSLPSMISSPGRMTPKRPAVLAPIEPRSSPPSGSSPDAVLSGEPSPADEANTSPEGGEEGLQQTITNQVSPAQQVQGQGGIPASRIPEKYHKVKVYPVLPDGIAPKDSEFRDNMWRVVLFPSSKPDSRKEVTLLSAAFDQMLEDVRATAAANGQPSANGADQQVVR